LDFSLSDEQRLLQHSMRAWLGTRHSFAHRREALQQPGGRVPGLWRALGDELGILALAAPDADGGTISDPITTHIVMQELGRALVNEPFLETVVLCGALLRCAGGAFADALLQRITDGDTQLAFAANEAGARYDPGSVSTRAIRTGNGWRLDGAKCVVKAAPSASGLLVSARSAGEEHDRDGISLFFVDAKAAGLERRDYPTLDGRMASDITLRDLRVPADARIGEAGAALATIEAAIDSAIAALCGEAIGVMGVMLDDTVAHTKSRRQFGQSLSTFQALQHRMVDMHVAIELARSAAYRAALSGSAAHERALATAAAKVSVGKACRLVAQEAVQLHGGMGMSDEVRVSHCFKRATVIESEFGSVDHHLQRHMRLMRDKDRSE
jgi:butyryl-CoA dehydrogenase